MIKTNANTWAAPEAEMTEKEFRILKDLIHQESGIFLPENRILMLKARLKRRLTELEISSFSDYYDYIITPEGQAHEIYKLINAVSTNKTEFFRENYHFDILENIVLPDLVERQRFKALNELFFWSAGCSTGEEPYTIAAVIDNYLSNTLSGEFSVVATDIDTDVLKVAEKAVYDEEDVLSIPLNLRFKYMMSGKGSRKGFCRVVPELREKVFFLRHNLTENQFSLNQSMDVIFCRNVLIYFNRSTQEEIFNRFYSMLEPGGYLFIGSSESVQGYDVPFKLVSPTVYQKY